MFSTGEWLSGKKKKKNPPSSAEDTGLSPGSGRSPGGGNGNPLQYSCVGNPMDRGAYGLQSTKSWTQLRNLTTGEMNVSSIFPRIDTLLFQTFKFLKPKF